MTDGLMMGVMMFLDVYIWHTFMYALLMPMASAMLMVTRVAVSVRGACFLRTGVQAGNLPAGLFMPAFNLTTRVLIVQHL